ncbi:MAG: C40 family peptidase [Bacteroidales bacterium]|jgi:hypothetical protein|nr:C40 family peptidase [Bacteroidales bacterium]
MRSTTHTVIVTIAFLYVSVSGFSQDEPIKHTDKQSIENILTQEIEGVITENLTTEQAINDSLINSDTTVTINSCDWRVPIDSVIAFGETFIGLPYRSRIEGVPQLMDCSGFMGMIFQNFGVTLPRSSAEIANITQTIPLKDARAGDFIFFKGRNANQNRVGHVALIIENNNGELKMLHSSVSKGITIDTYPDTYYYSKRFVKVGRLQ